MEDLVSLEREGSQTITLSLLEDAQRNEAAIFICTPGEPVERIGELSYPIASIAAEMLWPYVQDFLERPEILSMDVQIHELDLVPQDKARSFLKNGPTA